MFFEKRKTKKYLGSWSRIKSYANFSNILQVCQKTLVENKVKIDLWLNCVGMYPLFYRITLFFSTWIHYQLKVRWQSDNVEKKLFHWKTKGWMGGWDNSFHSGNQNYIYPWPKTQMYFLFLGDGKMNYTLTWLQLWSIILGYRTRTIITRCLYIFYPIFTAVYIVERLVLQTIYVPNKEILQFLGLKYVVYNQ